MTRTAGTSADLPAGRTLPAQPGGHLITEHMTVELGLSTIQGGHFTTWPVSMAAMLLSQLPMLVIFVVGPVTSIANTGIK